MEEFLANNIWAVYICALVALFVQEDLAVLGAASASVSGLGNPFFLFITITIGLTVSDLWKYWLGRAALTQGWARKHAESPRIIKARDLSLIHI